VPSLTITSVLKIRVAKAADSQELRQGQAFSQRLEHPEQAVAVRILGTPAYGDNRASEGGKRTFCRMARKLRRCVGARQVQTSRSL